MTDGLDDEASARPVETDAAQDHEAVEALLSSYDWQEQLRVARLKREKVLAERALLAAENDAAEARQVEKPIPVILPYLPRNLNAPEVVEAFPKKLANPVTAASVRPRVRLGLGIGLVAGVAIGLLLPQAAKIASADFNAQLAAHQPEAVPTLSPHIDAPQGASMVSSLIIAAASPAAASPAVTAPKVAPLLTRPDGPDRQTGDEPGAGNSPSVASDDPQILTFSVNDDSAAPLGKTWQADALAPNSDPSALVPSTQLANHLDAAILPPELPQDVSVGADAPTSPRSQAANAETTLIASADLQRHRVADRPPAELPLPAKPEQTPTIFNSVYIADAASYHLNLHLAPSASGEKERAQLGQLGLVNARVSASKFSLGQTRIAYYQLEDAQIATMLASLYGGQTMDMTGFTPSPVAGTLDIYLKD